MITVVHVITKLELGGAQQNTLYTCKNLDSNKYKVILIYGPGGLLDEQARSIEHIQTIEVPELVRAISPLNDFKAYLKLKSIFKDIINEQSGFEPNHVIVHTHSSKAGILGRLAAHAAKIPHIIHYIHGFGFHPGQNFIKRFIFLTAERFVSRYTHAFVSVSKNNLAEAQALSIIKPEQKVSIVRSGMDLDTFRPTGNKKKSENLSI